MTGSNILSAIVYYCHTTSATSTVLFFTPESITNYCHEYICLSVHPHKSETARPYFTKTFVHVDYSHGSVLFWWLCDM